MEPSISGAIPLTLPFGSSKICARRGKKVLFFANNASHTNPFYLKKLTRLGFEPSAEEIMTSGETQPNDVDAAAEADKPDFAFASLADVDELMFG